MAFNTTENQIVKDITIVAAFRDRTAAESAASELEAAGIDRQDIYLESSTPALTSSEVRETADGYPSRTTQHEGGIVHWFKSLFGAHDEDQTAHLDYESALAQGAYFLSVDTSQERIDQVEGILNRHNPTGISSGNGEFETTGTAVGLTSAGTDAYRSTPGTLATGTTESIPVVKEDLHVGKRSVLRGGVRIFSRVVETPVEETIGLREEHVRVSRQAVNRPATEADFAAGRSQSVELEEFAEEPVIAKQARVVEEIQVGKEVNERVETIKDSVRHTEVEVENIPADRVEGKTAGR